MKENSQSLSCVMIPVSDRQLLLPNVSIAEVVDFNSTDAGASTPEWLVGFLDWRGLTLPVISYDAANGGTLTVPGDNRGRIIVLNTIGDSHQQAPFMALVTQGIPSQARLVEEQIRKLDGEAGPADLMQVEVDGEAAWIPNLEYLESLAITARH
ncbi:MULTISPECIES: chemotaxis protein CheW [Marinobacter]|jgi:chemosensory pili system protein ChpC|uniref:Chemotaxis signal transduction protein n=1 Tax=Marinobacter excellens LAMA 842 TaxID=1306954 RepID=A0A137SC15_9GAMM|nr:MULTISPECIES: chemotaxis protein CheW [Marinobacter]MDX5439612.1 chemotaxis protein CheW [Alteromonadaceae bacterium]KXO09976.1 Chemotaxis signal transduction protein [Marinobacter excellens LAMA 842]MCD1631236.1 chemotaxis protein CheW [Marinobacter shengliensis]MDX5337107.1 chemotaxis protein CheW [Marinobacter sp.]MDX5388375.1 chemotaxis protein CheW [Marinobacter sp.]